MSNEIILYQPGGLTEKIEVRIDGDTVWLNQEQLVHLFNRDQSVISRHIRNVYKEGELDKKSSMQKMHIANSDKPVAFYNLDVIISVGYRVKSKQGAGFFLMTDANVAAQFSKVSEWAGSTRRIKLPNVCAGLGLRCMNPYKMLRRENARFVLEGSA